jgi:hypothetical protein
MPNAAYGPTPPYLFPHPDGSDLPAVAPDGGTPKTFTSERMELALVSDALVHNLATVAILRDRTQQVDVYVELMDPAGAGRVAAGAARIQITRVGAAAATLVGTPVMLTYTPNAAPWNTITADLVVLASGTDVAVQVFGLAAVPIRVRATIKLVGAQAQQVS